jgi:hypothetical protein
LTGPRAEGLIALEETGYVKEATLQELLGRYPDLLPGDQIGPENPRRWLPVSREMGIPGDVDETGRWSLDHLFLDQDGIPTLRHGSPRGSARRPPMVQARGYGGSDPS